MLRASTVACRLALLALVASGNVRADWIADLQSPDPAVRRATIFRIQTSDDPRIPAACLPLLNDSGLSIRRLAARAIGSRFYQIPDADRPRYLAALEACLKNRKSKPVSGTYHDVDDVTLMCQRAIGLLSRRYKSPPFSVSPGGEWVLYERRRCPVFAHIATQQHYLLQPLDPNGYGPDNPYYPADENETHPSETNILKTVDTNLPVAQLFAPHWRSDGNAAAFSLERLERRFYHPILVWTAATPSKVVVLDEAYFQPLLGTRYPQWGTTTDFVAWKGDKVLVRIYNCDFPDEGHPPDPGVVVSYDLKTGKIALER
ncbi:MAG TPA: HEAT repeat domain-containing protein [Chthoniobacterales bacterium]